MIKNIFFWKTTYLAINLKIWCAVHSNFLVYHKICPDPTVFFIFVVTSLSMMPSFKLLYLPFYPFHGIKKNHLKNYLCVIYMLKKL